MQRVLLRREGYPIAPAAAPLAGVPGSASESCVPRI
jgi:hypothetical protein